MINCFCRSMAGFGTMLGLSLFVLTTVTMAAEGDDIKPLEPEVMEASDEAEQVMSGVRIPEGWDIQLFAAEPDVANIVAFDVDYRGRIFVCETFRQNRGVTDNRAHNEKWVMADLAAKTVQDRIDYHKKLLGDAAVTYAQHDDRIRRLVDSNGDGVVDQSVVMANGFNHLEDGTGAGILVRGNEVYFTCIPKLWKLTDSNDDGEAEKRDVLSNGYGVRVAFRGHDLHGLTMGPDGRLYFSIGDRGYHIMTKEGKLLANPAVGAVFRCEVDGSDLEVFANGLRNPQELAFNDLGDLFSVDNNSDSGDQARIVHILQDGDTGWRMYYQYLPDRGPFNRENIWKPLHEEQPAYIVPPIANYSDGPSGLAYYPGTGFGDQLKNKFLLCDFRGGPSNSGIRTFELQSDGAFYKLAKDDQLIWTCLATDLAFGADGSLFVSDWVDGWDGLGKGRIYRLTSSEHSDSKLTTEVQEILQCEWDQREPAALVKDLQHIDRRIRLEAQWQLAARNDIKSLTAALGDKTANSIANLHAIWGLDQIARVNDELRQEAIAAIRPAFKSADDVVRAAAAKSAGERGDKAAINDIRSMLEKGSAREKFFAASALASLGDRESFVPVVNLLAANNNRDPALRHAGTMFLVKAVDVPEILKLTSHSNRSVRRAAVVALRRLESPQVSVFLDDKDPLVVAEAARAIHDVPIASSMPELAEVLNKPSSDLSLVRRALNANYRIGDEASAKRVAKFATLQTAQVEMRLEALSMLADWTSPDPRDRIINDYRPLEKRDAKIAPLALLEQVDSLMITDSTVREKMIDVASKLGVKKIAPEVLKRVNNKELQPSQRANALNALARLNQQSAIAVARKVDSSTPVDVMSTAIAVLSKYDMKQSLPLIIQSVDHANLSIRQQAWDILAQHAAKMKADAATKRIQVALDDYLAGKLNSAEHLNVIEAAKVAIPDATKRIDAHTQSLGEKDALAKWLPSIDGGNVDKGRTLFFENTKLSCVRCHKVDRAGGEVGPNLTTIGKQKDKRYLLEAICLPNATIAKGYETTVIVDGDAKVQTGIVRNETDEFVEILRADGTQIRIDQDEIELRRKGKSSMPDDLTNHMTMRDLRDLVAYLATLKVGRRAASDTE